MGTNLLSEFRGRCGDFCLVIASTEMSASTLNWTELNWTYRRQVNNNKNVRGIVRTYLQKSGLICDSWEMAVGNSTCMLFLATNLFTHTQKARWSSPDFFLTGAPNFVECRGGQIYLFFRSRTYLSTNKPNNVTTWPITLKNEVWEESLFGRIYLLKFRTSPICFIKLSGVKKKLCPQKWNGSGRNYLRRSC